MKKRLMSGMGYITTAFRKGGERKGFWKPLRNYSRLAMMTLAKRGKPGERASLWSRGFLDGLAKHSKGFVNLSNRALVLLGGLASTEG